MYKLDESLNVLKKNTIDKKAIQEKQEIVANQGKAK